MEMIKGKSRKPGLKKMIYKYLFIITLTAFSNQILAKNSTGIELNKTSKKNYNISILFLGKHSGMDKKYAKELVAHGVTFIQLPFFKALTEKFIKKFNLIIIDRLPETGAEYNVFGQYRILGYRKNMQKIWAFARNGGGVLLYTNLRDGGGSLNAGWNKEMKKMGVEAVQACIRDEKRIFKPWLVSGGQSYYSWTKNLTKHPVTKGLKRIYYPSANLRWDDCYTAPPLICDSTWTPLVKAMPGATLATQVSTKWINEAIPQNGLVLSAVRNFGKGRIGVLSINPYYTHHLGYQNIPSRRVGEMSPGIIDSIVLSKGNGVIPSDTGQLLYNLYGWLSQKSAKMGFGGYKAGEVAEYAEMPVSKEEKIFQPVLDFDNLVMPPSWRHCPISLKVGKKTYWPEVSDPLVTGKLKFFKALIGIHSNLSDGQGTVAQYAKEAKKAGYNAIVFSENFEKLSPKNWNKLLEKCEKNSTDDFICLPGYDIQDPEGNHFILIGPPKYPPASWLSKNGKRLIKPNMFTLGFYNNLVVRHRPAKGPLPYERLKHFQALTVYTYRNGKLLDNGFDAYAWQVMNGSNPHPVVVHEVFKPNGVSLASETGIQQILPSDTIKNAINYFRVGLPHFFDAPSRYMLSGGPIVYNWVISSKDIGLASENREHFRVSIGVKSKALLRSVSLYDGPKILRKWLPKNKNNFEVSADFQHSHQYGLYVVAEDSKGQKVITSSIRTVAKRYHYRCSDRQNWLGDMFLMNLYTGSRLPDGLDISMPIKGTLEASTFFPNEPGSCMAPKVNFPFTCNDISILDIDLTEKYTKAIFKDIGLDAMRSFPSQPSSIYTAKRRNYSFTPGKSGKHWLILAEFDITLKRDVEPVNIKGLFPTFAGLRGDKFTHLKNGKLITETIKNNQTEDIPVGSIVGGYIPLTKGFQIQNNHFGLAPAQGNPKIIPAGTRFVARFIFALKGFSPYSFRWSKYNFADKPENWLKAMGFAGSLPYKLSFTKGKLNSIAYFADITSEKGVVTGSVDTTADIPYDIPMEISGINKNWIAGSWRKGERIVYTGVFEGKIWPRLDVAKKGKFYAGNLLVSTNKNIVLEVVKWNKKTIKIEVHNPTAKTITTTISTPKEIDNYKAFSKKISIEAGSTIYLNSK